jgi:putative acetyltransferase
MAKEEEGGLRLQIRQDDLSNPQTRSLLALHFSGMRVNSPAGHAFALDLSGLQSPDVTVWSAWTAEEICGIAALRQFDGSVGELKSMRTHPNYLRRGVATALLEHIIEVARSRGLRTLSLETGSGPAFEAALVLYRRRGFRDGDPLGGYTRSHFNQFLHLAL